MLREDVGPIELTVRIESAAEPVHKEAPWMTHHPAPNRARLLARTMDGLAVQISAPVAWSALPGDCYAIAGELLAFPDQDFAQGLDARRLKARAGVYGLFVLKTDLLAEPVTCAPLSIWDRFRRQQRALADVLLAQGGGTTAAAVLLGDRRGLDVQRLDAYARAGVTHVLSVSGLHVSACALIVFTLFRVLFGLLRFLVRLPAHACAAAASAPVVAGYVLLTGAELPAVRSALMVAAALFARVSGRSRNGWWALSGSAIAILIVAPESSIEPTFLFSFVSVAALLLSPRWVTVASWPLSVTFFQQLSWIGLVTNLIAVPLSSFGVVLPGLLWLVMPHRWLASILGFCGGLLDHLAELTAFGALDIAVPFAGSAYVAWAFWRLRLRVAAICLGVGLVTSAIWPGVERHLSHDFSLHLLPVGQGDGMVLFGPGGRVIVIDTGGDPEGRSDPGRRVLRPFLLAHAVRRIDCLIVTHQHPDHFGGMRTLQATFAVTRTLTNRDTFDCAPLESLRARYEELSENDNSLVLRLRHAGHTLMLTGDIEALGEELLSDVDTDVLKVAHHGSRTSTSAEWLAKTTPRIALISAGRGNHFGHPHSEVLERLHAAGIAVYRTDIHGHVAVSLGAAVTVRAFRLRQGGGGAGVLSSTPGG